MSGATKDVKNRVGFFGASDSAKIMGLSQWGTPLSVYMETIGEMPPPDPANEDAVYWGNVLEDVVAQEYSRRTGNKVRRVTRALKHPDYPYIAGHIDRDIVGQPGLLECKTSSQWMASEWGPDGSDDVPAAYRIQVYHYMLLTGSEWADIAALIGGNDFRIYRVMRDEKVIEGLKNKLVRFWEDHVEPRIPPEASNANDLLLLYPEDSGTTVVATTGAQAAHVQLVSVKERIKALKKEQEALEFTLKDELGEGTTLVGPEGTLATWKAQTSTRLDTKRLKAEDTATFNRFALESSSRVFRLKGA